MSAHGRSARPTLARVATHDVLLGLLAILVAAFVAGGLSDYHVYVVTIVVIFAIIGASHVVLFGAAGQPSVGHAAILGAGAYTAVTIASDVRTDVILELIGGVAVGTLLGAVVGLPSLRIGSLYLAIATLALSVVGQQVFFQWDAITGGGAGIAAPPLEALGTSFNGLGLLYIVLVVAGLFLLFVRNLFRGRVGRAWNAVRTSPTAASSVGISLGWQKVAAFAVSGGLVGGAGVLYAHAVTYLSPEDYSVELSIITLVVAVVGGQRYLWGAVLGAFFVQGVPEFLRAVGSWRDFIYGAVFILVMLFLPEGFAGAVRSGWRRWGPGAARTRRAVPEDGGASDGAGTAAARARVVEAPPVAPAPAPRANGSHGTGGRLEIQDVKILFGGVAAVSGVSLDVTAGSVVGLVGPNGAGKTTLLNAISGFVRATEGSVAVDGEPILGRSPQHRTRLGVARTFQNLSLHHGLSVLDHVLIGQHAGAGYGALSQALRLPRFVRGERRMRGRAHDLLEALELERFAEDAVENLPYGIQKRVDVARAIVSSPRLLLLDEPAAGLTPEEGDDLVNRVLELAGRQGSTVVLVEHNIDLVMRVADRVVALNFGEVIADDVPSQVRVHEEFVRSYLGA